MLQNGGKTEIMFGHKSNLRLVSFQVRMLWRAGDHVSRKTRSDSDTDSTSHVWIFPHVLCNDHEHLAARFRGDRCVHWLRRR